MCTSVHDDVPVALPRLTTSDYPEDARADLGRAVTRAREAAGWIRRRDFADHAGVSLRSLVKLEGGEEGVGRRVLEFVGRALPGWDEDTPRRILEGGDPPHIDPAPEPTEESQAELTEEGQRMFEAISVLFDSWDLKMTERLLAAFREEVAIQLAERPRFRSTNTESQHSGNAGD